MAALAPRRAIGATKGGAIGRPEGPARPKASTFAGAAMGPSRGGAGPATGRPSRRPGGGAIAPLVPAIAAPTSSAATISATARTAPSPASDRGVASVVGAARRPAPIRGAKGLAIAFARITGAGALGGAQAPSKAITATPATVGPVVFFALPPVTIGSHLAPSGSPTRAIGGRARRRPIGRPGPRPIAPRAARTGARSEGRAGGDGAGSVSAP